MNNRRARAVKVSKAWGKASTTMVTYRHCGLCRAEKQPDHDELCAACIAECEQRKQEVIAANEAANRAGKPVRRPGDQPPPRDVMGAIREYFSFARRSGVGVSFSREDG